MNDICWKCIYFIHDLDDEGDDWLRCENHLDMDKENCNKFEGCYG